MNKEFRVWDVEEKCWIPQILWMINSKGELYTWDKGEQRYIKETIKYELCQYVGLKDKKGKKIFDGDVVEYKGCTPRAIFIVENHGAEFELSDCSKGTGHRCIYDNNDYQIIGNIRENPELLK